MWNKITKGAGLFFSAMLVCGTFSTTMEAQHVSGSPQTLNVPLKPNKTQTTVVNNPQQPDPQSPLPNATTLPCATDRLMQQYITENHLEAVYAHEEQVKQDISALANNDRTIKTIPVVFHIVYNPNKPASAQMNNLITPTIIDDIVARLNADFSKTTTTGVRSAWHSSIANTNIQFCLANRDPQGNVTTGITRTTTSQSYFDSDDNSPVYGENAMKTSTSGIVGWNHLKYVNIWLCDITDNMNLCSGGCTAGYAYLGTTSQGTLPNTQGGIMIDGIVLDYRMGVFEYPGQLSNLEISRTISHEMGHYLGLEHTFKNNSNSCTGDDGFSDTPKIKGPFQNFYPSCSSGTSAQSCTSGTLWQYENLMDYSDCFIMFTTQQSQYMNLVLTNGRYGLVNNQPTSCVPLGPVPPEASFTGCNSNVVENATVTFTNTSTNNPTGYQWTITPPTGVSFVGGTSATSQNPQVSFANAGTYSVKLVATNSAGADSVTNATCITVVLPGQGGCDTLANIGATDTIYYYKYSTAAMAYVSGMNTYGDKAKAEKFSGASYTPGNNVVGTYVYFGKFKYASAASNVDVKVWNASGTGGSPGANALGTKNLLLNTIPTGGSFPGVMYVPFNSPVAVSGDFFVGVEFTDPYVAGDTVVLYTNLIGYSPSPGTAWEKYPDNSWHTFEEYWEEPFALAIMPVLCPMTTSDNAIAADVDNISLYPNPSTGAISVMVGLNKVSEVNLEVYNSVGQLITAAAMQSGNGGRIDFDLSGKDAGMYFVKIQTQSSVITKRLIINK